MPKSNKPPKYSKMNRYAVVYVHGKPHYLGLYGSEESKIAYARFLAEMQANPVCPLPCGKKNVTVRELAAAFLDHAKSNPDSTEYRHCRVITLDFLGKLYGDSFPVDNFKPRCLMLVREEMIKSRRFCRNTVNSYVRRIVSMFTWGVAEELVNPNTALALKAVKSLPKGYTDTFDNQEREPVSDDVVERTLPFMSKTVRTMVQIQRITGMRPSEVYQMTVGDIDRTRENGLWHYVLGSHKTEKHVGKKVIPLGKQTLMEWMGLCLTPITKFQKALFIIGPKRGGKGTVFRILQQIVGTHNATSLGSLDFGRNFGLQPLIGK